MSKRKQPDCKLTIREAFEKHAFHDRISKSSMTTKRASFSLWEKLTDNPPVGDITNETFEAFRAAALAAPKAPSTVNSVYRDLRVVLRRLGPQQTGNPFGLGIIPRIPAMRLVPVQRKRPYRIPLDDLTRVYIACKHAQYPRIGIAPVDWWRALLVTAYTTGLRKGDLLAGIKRDDVDLEFGELYLTATKTKKEDVWPLHPVAVKHIKRIWLPERELLFCGLYVDGRRFYKVWHHILKHAVGIKRPFGLHDIRRTACSEIDRVERGLGRVLLQHAPRDVTTASYLNMADELRDAISKMRLPIGFKSGPKMIERQQAQERANRIKLTGADFHIPTGSNPDDWEFEKGVDGFRFRGRWCGMRGKRLKCLEVLVKASKPVSAQQLTGIVCGQPADGKASQKRVCAVVSAIRARLRICFGLEHWDPLPCVGYGNGGVWTVSLPADIASTIKAVKRKVLLDQVTASEIRAARRRAGWSQADLGKRLGVSRRAVSEWERRKHSIKKVNARKVIEVLGPFFNY